MSMTAAEQLAEMERMGLESISNAEMASRFPPGTSIGMNPSTFYDNYERGGLCSRLQGELGEPLPSLNKDFGNAAPKGPEAPDEPNYTPKLDNL